ncbi:unnamed protein product [Durusdinium trenchii]|uniref:Uncharacterized protein n=1 Tax=Durusdinium trenchii TaxID=1381693 RepID=A0ABP0JY23_9DINO
MTVQSMRRRPLNTGSISLKKATEGATKSTLGCGTKTDGYEVQVEDLQRALAAKGVEVERQQLEIQRLQEAFQATADMQLWHRHGHQLQLRQLMGTTSAQLARCGELERLLALERSEHQRLKAQVAEAQVTAAAAEAEQQSALKSAADAERYARDARANVQQKVDEALVAVRKQMKDELEIQRKAWQHELANALPLKLAREVLSAYAELWRCGCAVTVGTHALRAERALRRLFDLDVFTTVIPPRDELLQEPLRRAMGHEAAKHMGETLVAELEHCHASGPSSTSDHDGWAVRPWRVEAMVAAHR